jgi:biopolymer transport protein ExbD
VKKRTRETAIPDITPLIDVVFILLIFFMVSTVFKKDELALMLKLPSAKDGTNTSKNVTEKVLIELTTDKIALNGKTTTLEDLEIFLKDLTNKKIPTSLRIDQEVKYSRVIKILDALKRHQLNNLSLVTIKEKNSSK